MVVVYLSSPSPYPGSPQQPRDINGVTGRWERFLASSLAAPRFPGGISAHMNWAPDFLRALAGAGPVLAPAESTRTDVKLSLREQIQLVGSVAHGVPH